MQGADKNKPMVRPLSFHNLCKEDKELRRTRKHDYDAQEKFADTLRSGRDPLVESYDSRMLKKQLQLSKASEVGKRKPPSTSDIVNESVLNVESKGESKATHLPKIPIRFEVVGNPDVFPPDAKGQAEMGFVDISVKLKVNIEHPAGINEKDVFIKEMEVDGIAQGDYVGQTLSPLSGLPNLEHSANPKAIRVSAFFDNVSTMITTNDPNKPFSNGSLRWEIPVLFENEGGENIGQTTIVQEYIINNGLLTMSKGGQELLRLQLG